jgi:hypothetical protein
MHLSGPARRRAGRVPAGPHANGKPNVRVVAGRDRNPAPRRALTRAAGGHVRARRSATRTTTEIGHVPTRPP